jgi:hypothetical protein
MLPCNKKARKKLVKIVVTFFFVTVFGKVWFNLGCLPGSKFGRMGFTWLRMENIFRVQCHTSILCFNRIFVRMATAQSQQYPGKPFPSAVYPTIHSRSGAPAKYERQPKRPREKNQVRFEGFEMYLLCLW